MVEDQVKRSVERYSIHREIASGGMATVYLGRLNAAGGVGRIVAVKRLHQQLARDPEFVKMFLDEARLAARIHHPNVVPTLDVLADEGELFVVMDYVRGESLSKLRRAAKAHGERIPVPIVTSIMCGVLQGLHAAHEAVDERGEPLGIVHRDVSPQNVIVGEDGTARMLDFGVAKAASRLHETRDGKLKGKLGYMAPEQISDREVTKLCDIYAAGIVLWEALTGRHLFQAKTDGETLSRLLNRNVEPPSQYNEEVNPNLDAVALRALEQEPSERFATARQMAKALDAAVRGASALEVGAWVERMAESTLESRREVVRDIESGGADSLSGFPSLPVGVFDDDGPASEGSSGTKGQLATAVTVPSQTRPPLGTRERKPWLLLGILALVVGAAGLVLITDPFTGWTDAGEPAAPSATSTTVAETATAPELTSTEPPSEPTDATATATSSEVPEAPTATVETSARASTTSRPRPPRKTTPPQRPPGKRQGDDPNDIDSLIETRK